MPQCPTEAGDFGDRTGGERVEDLLGDGSSGGVAVLVVGGPDLLGAGPGDLDLDVSLVGCERRYEPGALAVGQVLLAKRAGRAESGTAGRSFGRRCPWMSCWTRRRTSSTTPVAISTRARNASPRWRSRSCRSSPERPGNRSSSRAWILPCSSRVRSSRPVSSLGPRPPNWGGLVDTWCHPCSCTPRMVTFLEPSGVGVGCGQQRSDRLPHRAPPGAQPATDPVDAGVFSTDLLDRPPARPGGQHRSRCADPLVLFHETWRPGRPGPGTASAACATGS